MVREEGVGVLPRHFSSLLPQVRYGQSFYSFAGCGHREYLFAIEPNKSSIADRVFFIASLIS